MMHEKVGAAAARRCGEQALEIGGLQETADHRLEIRRVRAEEKPG
jgi:hypothetical protein